MTPPYDPSQQWDHVFTRPGGAYDRGSADAAYGRPNRPHLYEGAPLASTYIAEQAMTEEELAAYQAGYEDGQDEAGFYV